MTPLFVTGPEQVMAMAPPPAPFDVPEPKEVGRVSEP